MDFNTSVAPPSQAPLDLRPPVIQNPLEYAAQAQQIQASQQQTAASQQQMQTTALQQQQMQMDLAQRKAINSAYQQAWAPQPDGTLQLDTGKLTQILAQSGHGEAAPGIAKNAMEFQSSLVDLQQKRQSLEAAAASRLAATVQGADYDPAVFHALFTTAVNQRAIDPSHYAPIDQAIQQAQQADPTGQQAKALVKQATAQMLSSQQATSQKDQADAALATSKAQREQMVNDLMKKGQQAPTNGQHPVDAILGGVDPQAAAAMKPAYDSLMAQPPDENGRHPAADTILEAAAKHASEIAMAQNPAMTKAKADDAAAIETATGPIKARTAATTEAAIAPIKVNTAVQTEIQKAAQAPGAFSPVIDPAARAKAIDDYQKSSSEYADKVGQAKQLADFVSAAQSGNKAAPGLIPIAEVRQLVNRVNRQELQSVSNSAGSAYDRLQGFLGKYTEGQPIPPQVLSDTKAISQTMQQAAQRTYGYKVQLNRQTYGSKAQPVDLDNGSQAGGKLPEIGDQASYDKLPKGAQYTHNGQTLTKQ